MTDLLVQLVYSDGRVPDVVADLHNLYPIALLPFVLNVPADNVDLIISALILNNDTVGNEIMNIKAREMEAFNGGNRFFPDGYHDYFMSVFTNARTPVDGDPARAQDGPPNAPPPPATATSRYYFLPQSTVTPHIRVFTGHGYGKYDGGFLQLGDQTIGYQGVEPGTLLTVIDACNAAHGVACLTNTYPYGNVKRFNSRRRKQMFNALTSPFVCDRNEHVYAFKIGPGTLHENPTDVERKKRLTDSFGDAIICCLIVALCKYEPNSDGDLNALFAEEYGNMNTALMNVDSYTANPCSNLQSFQVLIDNGQVALNKEWVAKSELFRRQGDWFLSTHKPMGLLPTDKPFADELIDRIVLLVASWHSKHPTSDCQSIAESESAYQKILALLGDFSQKLAYVILEHDEETGQVRQIDVTDDDNDGIGFAFWAVSCSDTPEILHHVRKAIKLGEWGGCDID